MNTASWLVGSEVLDVDADIDVDGDIVTVVAGAYYVYDPVASLSLLSQVEAALAGDLANVSVFMTEGGRVRITSDDVFTITWPAVLQELLGFDAVTGPTDDAVAPRSSTHLWRPGWCATPLKTPLGVSGYRQYDTRQTSSRTGLTAFTTRQAYTTINSFAWQHVDWERVQTTDDGEPGEFARIWYDVISAGKRFKIYNLIAEEQGSLDEVTWVGPLGPYKQRLPAPYDFYNRQTPNVDLHVEIKLDVFKTSEHA